MWFFEKTTVFQHGEGVADRKCCVQIGTDLRLHSFLLRLITGDAWVSEGHGRDSGKLRKCQP